MQPLYDFVSEYKQQLLTDKELYLQLVDTISSINNNTKRTEICQEIATIIFGLENNLALKANQLLISYLRTKLISEVSKYRWYLYYQRNGKISMDTTYEQFCK